MLLLLMLLLAEYQCGVGSPQLPPSLSSSPHSSGMQTGLPMPAMAVAGAQFRLSPEDRVLLWQTYLPWATRAGMRSADLMCLYYERHLDEPLDELRRRWRIEPAPQPPPRLIRRRRNSSSSSSSSSSSANGTDEGKLATASVGETRRQ